MHRFHRLYYLLSIDGSPIPPQPLLPIFLQLIGWSISRLLTFVCPKRRIRMRIIRTPQARVS